MGLENTRFHVYAESTQVRGVLFIDLFRFLGRGGAVECRPASAPDVAVKSKLRDDQRGPASFRAERRSFSRLASSKMRKLAVFSAR